MGAEPTKRGKMGAHREVPPDCIVVREEISAAWFEDGAFVSEAVSVHLEKCAACRGWRDDLRRVHAACRTAGAAIDPSGLTARALERSAAGAAGGGEVEPLASHEGRVFDEGALFVVLLGVVLFNAMLAFSLGGGARTVYPAVGFVVMTAAALWVYRDSARRGMRSSFWSALQPFSLPAGLVAYLLCRERGASRCAACGRPVSGGDRFCHGCGGTLVELCCGCGRPVRKEHRVCPFCGRRLEECSPREDEGGASCAWSRAQMVFVAVVNTLFVAGFVAALVRGGPRTALAAALLYLLGWFPVFNWVVFDSRRRGMRTIPWGVLVLATLYIGLIVYLACRRDERVICPVCGSNPAASFNFCPCCGSALGPACPACGARVRPADRFCRSCGFSPVTEAVSPPSRG
jgi:hypothetical protein